MVAFSTTLLLLAAVGSALVAGLCFAFASFLMRSFESLGAPDAIRAMQAVNREILRSTTMPVWLGTAAVGLAAAIFAEERTFAVAGLLCYLVGALLITRMGNIPLNEGLDRVDPDAPEEAANAWRDYRASWGRWNALRTLACALATAGFALAA